MNKDPMGTVLLSVVISFLLVFSTASMGFTDQSDDIQAAIEKKGARWNAGETSMSKLSDAEKKLRLNTVKQKTTGQEKILSLGKPPTGLPASLDWRSDRADARTDVRNQGNCGRFWDFDATAALEAYTFISRRKPDPEDDRRWSYVCTTGKSVTAETIKNALYTYGPLATTMEVYYDFYFYTEGVYKYSYGSYQGGHAILIVGYDDLGGYFIARNSWGTNWGEAGFFRIAYAEIGPRLYFGEWTIACHNPEAVSCSYTIASSVTVPRAASGGSFTVTTGNQCTWSAHTNSSWIKVAVPAAPTGPGTVFYTVEKNDTGSNRTGAITIKEGNATKATFTITQKKKFKLIKVKKQQRMPQVTEGPE